MANRVLRDWTDSDKMEELSVHAERFFTRLIMKVDDFGCYPANVKLLKSGLFPLKDTLSLSDVDQWLTECYVNGLILLYEVKGKKYLQILEFRQRLRQARGKYPLPTDCQLTVNGHTVDGLKRNEVETESETEVEEETKSSLADENKIVPREAIELTEAICDYFDVQKILTSKIYNSIDDFVTTVAHRNELKIVAAALQNYMVYKARSQEAKHNAITWIGTKADHYNDGKWKEIDWHKKLKNYEQQSVKRETTAASAVITGGKTWRK